MTQGPEPAGDPAEAGPPPEPSGAAGDPTDEQVRAVFAQIVAGLEPGDAAPGRPMLGLDTDSEPTSAAPGASGGGQSGPSGASPTGVPPPWRVQVPAEPPEEHFVPPPPRPLPRDDLGFWVAVVGLVAGPCWLLYLVLADPHGNRLWAWVAGGLTLAGFVAMVLRPPGEPADPHDDGARV